MKTSISNYHPLFYVLLSIIREQVIPVITHCKLFKTLRAYMYVHIQQLKGLEILP